MCILSATVNSVANTNIFTCAYDDNARQFMVYSNRVDTYVPNNTMILPVPNPHSVEFVNLSKYATFFDDCKKSFYEYPERSMHMYASRSLSLESSYTKPLPVFHVGSYKVSIVPHITQFSRLDPREFTIEPDVPNVLYKLYDDTFGYLICKLREGSHKYHPFAYTHFIHDKRKLFVPTYHYHSHGHASAHSADWDHEIYSVRTDMEHTSKYKFSNYKLDFEKLPSFLGWIKDQKMSKLVRQGSWYPNKDLWLTPLPAKQPPPPSYPSIQEGSTPDYTFPIFGKQGLANIRKAFRGE